MAEVTRESYPLHFAVADKLGGKVGAFDQYLGPYITSKIGKLWIQSVPEWRGYIVGEGPVWFSTEADALEAVKEALGEVDYDDIGGIGLINSDGKELLRGHGERDFLLMLEQNAQFILAEEEQ
mgnify:CR=1 FL=1